MKVSSSGQLIRRFAAAFFAVAGAVLAPCALAQAKTSSLLPPGTPVAPQAPPLGNPEETDARYVKPENYAAYVAKISATLAMSQRAFDSFGRNQDPNYRPPQPELIRPDTAEPSQQVAQAPLSELVSSIQVTMLMPTKQTFFVGDRAFHRGDRFPLRTPAGSLVNVEVLSVNSSSIVFRETTKGEVGVLRLGGSPEGVKRGTNLEMPPGITVPNPAAPLDLQPSQDPNPPR